MPPDQQPTPPARSTPPVSVVIPVYDGAPYLEAAIGSVLRQSAGNLRLLLVDDASRDASPAIAHAAAARDRRVTVRTNPANMGLYASLRHHIATIDTPFTVVLMQDDTLAPDHCARFLALAAAHPEVPMFWADVDHMDAAGTLHRRGERTGAVSLTHPSPQAVRRAFERGCYWTISGSFTRTAHFERHPFRPDLKHAADYDLLVRTLQEAPIAYLHDTLTTIRLHEGQLSRAYNRSARDLADYMTIFREVRAAGGIAEADARAIHRRLKRGEARRVVARLRRGHVGPALRALRLLAGA
ncbi:glycosyltransferase [Acuticoccus sp. I52.16.1]|uniref:glycosyltransferase family 2 protein n=1 Tax=Acuticoccus sp. I52.16.1 TaxID=2928472 RepID=UPI001FD09ACF|nr:glycosyltransferase [Acuticoccus sp. I52.16.1]UOM37210.1 glycosyltransferase [Acuticoccus sp. I52.16.1]